MAATLSSMLVREGGLEPLRLAAPHPRLARTRPDRSAPSVPAGNRGVLVQRRSPSFTAAAVNVAVKLVPRARRPADESQVRLLITLRGRSGPTTPGLFMLLGLACICAGQGLFAEGGKYISSQRPITWLVSIILTLASIVLMLSCTSPEFSWDEADYLASTANHWGFLWGGFDYVRHAHGPMAIYLAKLGQEVLPVRVGSLEGRLRFFEALV